MPRGGRRPNSLAARKSARELPCGQREGEFTPAAAFPPRTAPAPASRQEASHRPFVRFSFCAAAVFPRRVAGALVWRAPPPGRRRRPACRPPPSASGRASLSSTHSARTPTGTRARIERHLRDVAPTAGASSRSLACASASRSCARTTVRACESARARAHRRHERLGEDDVGADDEVKAAGRVRGAHGACVVAHVPARPLGAQLDAVGLTPSASARACASTLAASAGAPAVARSRRRARGRARRTATRRRRPRRGCSPRRARRRSARRARHRRGRRRRRRAAAGPQQQPRRVVGLAARRERAGEVEREEVRGLPDHAARRVDELGRLADRHARAVRQPEADRPRLRQLEKGRASGVFVRVGERREHVIDDDHSRVWWSRPAAELALTNLDKHDLQSCRKKRPRRVF